MSYVTSYQCLFLAYESSFMSITTKKLKAINMMFKHCITNHPSEEAYLGDSFFGHPPQYSPTYSSLHPTHLICKDTPPPSTNTPLYLCWLATTIVLPSCVRSLLCLVGVILLSCSSQRLPQKLWSTSNSKES